jgi:small subunit ribosomal protein S1
MEENIKQDKNKSHSEFEKLLADDLQKRDFKEGSIVEATIEEIGKKFVFVNLNLKSSGIIPKEEFTLTKEKIDVGSKIEVLLEKIENKNGEVVVSRTKALRAKSWSKMEKAFEENREIQATIISKCKGGFIADYDSVLCFLPGSQVSLKPMKNMDSIMNTPQTFEIVKVDQKRQNIVLSRRSIMEKARDKDREKNMANIKEGQILENCVCKSLTSWGAFFSYENLELLVHINEMSWSRVSAPSDLLKIGQTCRVLVNKLEGTRISGSLKRLQPDVFIEAAKKFKPGMIIENCIVQSIKDYGAFVEVAPGITGLVHNSECDHLSKTIHPSKVLSVSQKISVKILTLDTAERKLSLSYKDCFPSPWITFKEKYKKDATVSCKIKNKTDYAYFLFIEDTPIVGMLHVNNLSWDANKNEEELNKYHKNDVLKCQIIELDEENARVQLSLKHLQSNPFDFFKDKSENSIITVEVASFSKNGLYVYAGGKKEMKILIKKNELAKEDRTLQASRFTPGSRIDVMIKSLQYEKSKVELSVKSAEEAETKEAIKKFGSEGAGTGAVLGDILGKALKIGKKKK